MPQTKKPSARKKVSTPSKTTQAKTQAAAKAKSPAKTLKPKSPVKSAGPQAAPKLPRAKALSSAAAARRAKPAALQSAAASKKPSLKKGSPNKPSPKKQGPSRQSSRKQRPEKQTALKSAAKKATPLRLPQSNLEALKLARHMAKLLLEKKAVEVVLFDVYQKSSYADVIVVASGEAGPHLSALSKHLWESLKKDNLRPHSVEGSGNTSWVLMDFGDVVVHLFSPEIRALYDLDGLWSDVPRESFR